MKPKPPSSNIARLNGLVLAGGRSTRMQRDKAALEYRPGVTQLDAAMSLLDGRVARAFVSVHHKTGVEMEALTGASVAALTVYDMCKALSHDIRIESVQLVEKTGGKQDFQRK